MKNLKQLRIEKGLSQGQLAKLTHITQTNISRWENEETQMSVGYLTILADFFGVSTDYLLGRENDYGLVEVRNTNTPKETEVLSLLNALDEDHQVMMIDIMKKFADTTEKEKAFCRNIIFRHGKQPFQTYRRRAAGSARRQSGNY